jgi:hypothetical protein
MKVRACLFCVGMLTACLGFPSSAAYLVVAYPNPLSTSETGEVRTDSISVYWQRGHLEGIMALLNKAESSGWDGNEWLYLNLPHSASPIAGDTGRAQFDAFVAVLQEAERLHTWAEAFPAYSIAFRALASDRLESVARPVEQHLEEHPHLERTFRYRYLRKRLDEQQYHISKAPPPKWEKAMERYTSKGLGYVVSRTWADTNWAIRILGMLTVLSSFAGLYCMAKYSWSILTSKNSRT